MNRRDFLKNLGLGTAALYLGGCSEQPADNDSTIQEEPIQETTQTLEDLLTQDIEFTADDLYKHYDVNITPEELVYLTRAIYHEGSDEKALVQVGTRWITNKEGKKEEVPVKAFDLDQLQESYRRIAHVINNRYQFDNCTEEFENLTGKLQFSKNGTFESILRECKSIDEEGRPRDCQFSCTHFHYKDFQTAEKEGEYSLATGDINSDRALLAYRALLEVLTGEHQDPTGRALWYKNKKLAEKQKGKPIKWNGEEAFATETIECSEIEKIPSTSIAKRIEQRDPKITCRADQSFRMKSTNKFLSHDYYTVEAEERKEMLYDSGNDTGHTYKNGKWLPRQSFSKKVPAHLRK
ncbi:twin-arginine translocation signal domain-containing protein [archaeon]|jgi:hypothetical protein|nr:twin-arginine translocation signal domain-containing protein [archaeon]MBT4416891.1 twin-arginine translocation signal domain-containing protein [archaeon]